jgi:hypothetical protein
MSADDFPANTSSRHGFDLRTAGLIPLGHGSHDLIRDIQDSFCLKDGAVPPGKSISGKAARVGPIGNTCECKWTKIKAMSAISDNAVFAFAGV